MKKTLFILSLVAILILSGCGDNKGYVNKPFLSEDEETVVYESLTKNLTWGKYQSDEDALPEGAVELAAESIYAESEEDFTAVVADLKGKLDVIKIPYAFGYAGKRAHEVSVKLEAEKIGLPILALLNVNSQHENGIVSSMGDFSIYDIKNLRYTPGENNKYDITVDIPELYSEEFEKYCKENIGRLLYLKLGVISFSSTVITEDVKKDSITFHGMNFLGKNTDETKYEVIMELAEYVVNKNYDGIRSTVNFGLAVERETKLGIPYITELDETLIERLSTAYPEVSFTRRGVANVIDLRFEDYDNKALTTEDYFRKIEDIYKICNFDDGSYSDVSFSWPSLEKDGYGDCISFYKYDGKMKCSYISDRVEYKAKNDPFLSQYISD